MVALNAQETKISFYLADNPIDLNLQCRGIQGKGNYTKNREGPRDCH